MVPNDNVLRSVFSKKIPWKKVWISENEGEENGADKIWEENAKVAICPVYQKCINIEINRLRKGCCVTQIETDRVNRDC